MSSTEIPRPDTLETRPFWPADRRRLVVKFVFEGDKVIANGFDPDLDPDQIATVFTATLRPDQPEAFLHAVATGIAGTPIASPTPSNDNETLNTVVVSPGSGPGDGGGPKIPDTAGSTDYEITLAL